MAGAVIENMSTKKLCVIGGILLISQVIAFLVGGLMGKQDRLQGFCRPKRQGGSRNRNSDRRQLHRAAFFFSGNLVAGASLQEGPASELLPNSLTRRPFPLAAPSTCLLCWCLEPALWGVQLKNPFYGFWTTDVDMELALMAFITIAGICLCLYFLFLCFLVFKVFQNFHGKPLSLPPIKKTFRIQYQELNIRFKFLMVITLICAAMTIIIFIVRQVPEGHWKWGDFPGYGNGAFFTGIYGMWNLYVFTLLFLYAPSHEKFGEDQLTVSWAVELFLISCILK